MLLWSTFVLDKMLKRLSKIFKVPVSFNVESFSPESSHDRQIFWRMVSKAWDAMLGINLEN